jgi:hypothetical protein
MSRSISPTSRTSPAQTEAGAAGANVLVCRSTNAVIVSITNLLSSHIGT